MSCSARSPPRLRPDGTFLMQDILASSHLEKNLENPIATFLYTISTMHCMTVSLAQGGAGLGTCWGRELAEKMLRDAGFADVTVEKLPHDDMNYYYIAGSKVDVAGDPRQACDLNVELDALRERQVVGIVDGAGHAAHVGLPRIAARFAAAARFLFAAERAADLRAARADVHVHDAAIRTGRRREPLGLAHIARENRRRQTLRHVVVNADRFVEFAITHEVQNRRKRFLLNDRRIGRNFDDGRPHVVAARRHAFGHAAAAVNFAALLLGPPPARLPSRRTRARR